MRDADFQALLAIAADVHRLQKGLRVVKQAAQVFARHPDQEHVQLLLASASLITDYPEPSQGQGHGSIQLTPWEIEEESSEGLNLSLDEVPRPTW